VQAVMNIVVNVQGARRAQAAMAGLATQTATMQRTANRAGMANAAMWGRGALSGMSRYGKNLQWVGRQIEYNFTLPLAIATGVATKWALENEAAMTRLRKVYDDFGGDVRRVESEINDLGVAFRRLSDLYGVVQSEVIEVGASFAQAGQSGVMLAKNTRTAMDLSILGTMELGDAVQSLIAIQAQYNLSSDELRQTLYDLNAVENTTAVRLRDLVEAMRRGAGTAREAGVDHREFAAYVAAIAPAAGSAVQAGNGLKTMVSRLMAPTKQANDIMGALGLNIGTAEWESKNFTERLMDLSEALEDATGAQRMQALTTIFTRFQVSRAAVLMRALTTENSYYAKAMEATADPMETQARAMREIEAVLMSSPQGFKILTAQVRNYATEIVTQFIPTMLMVLAQIRDWMQAFAALDPQVRQTIFGFALFIIVVGPILRIIGASILLIERLMAAVRFLGAAIYLLISGPMKMLVVAFGGIVKGAFWVAQTLAVVLGGAIWQVSKMLSVVLTGALRIVLARAVMPFAAMVGTAFMHMALAAQVAVMQGMIPALRYLSASMLGMVLPSLGKLWAAMGSFAAWVVARASAFAAWVTGLFLVRTAQAATTAVVVASNAAQAGSFLVVQGTMLGVVPVFAWVGQKLVAFVALSKLAFLSMGKAALALFAGGFVNAGKLAVAGVAKAFQLILALVAGNIKGLVMLMARGAGAMALALTGPWAIVIGIVGAALYYMRDHVRDAVRWIIDAFNQLPNSLVGALNAVIRIVRSAALQVYEWLSFLNPFVRHSPSLVESVQAGVRIIAREYASLANIGTIFAGGLRALDRFKAATLKARREMSASEVAKMRTDVVTVAPGAGGAFDGMVAGIRNLEGALARVEVQYRKQDAVVVSWRAKLDQANAALKAQEDRLESLAKKADALKTRLDAAQQGLDALARMPIDGMRAYEDALFDNENAQKRLRLEMMKLEEVHGPIDDLQKKMAALQGDIEMLSGKREDLRLAGAGSDILGAYDAQIDQMRAAQKALMEGGAGAGGPAQEMQTELERLKREAEKLQLERDLEFDPLTRQIERMTEAYEEMSFDRIVAGITRQKAAVDSLTAAYDKAQGAVDAQQAVVDAAQRRADAIQAVYDIEEERLQRLGDAYDGIQSMIRDMNAELSGFASAASSQLAEIERARSAAEAAKKASSDADAKKAAAAAAAAAKKAAAGGAAGKVPAHLTAFDIAGEGDFDIPGGEGFGIEEGSIQDMIDELERDLGGLWSGFDMFAPVREKWEQFKGWFMGVWDSLVGWWQGRGGLDIGSIFTRAQATIGDVWANINSWFEDSSLATFWENLKGTVSSFLGTLKRVWGFIEGPLMDTFELLRDFVTTVIGNIVEELGNWWRELRGPLAEAWGNIMAVVKVAMQVIGTVFSVVWLFIMAAWEGLLPVVKPILDFLAEAFRNAMQIIRGVIDMVLALINGDWRAFTRGLMTVIDGLWDFIYNVFENGLEFIKGIFVGIWNFLKGIWNRIYDWLVGNSIIPDLVKAIIGWFVRLRDRAKEIWNKVRDFIIAPIRAVWTWLKNTWNTIGTWLADRWRSIRDRARDIWQSLRDAVVGRIAALRDRVRDVVAALRTWLSDRWGAIRDRARDLWQSLREAVVNRIVAVRDRVKDIVAALRTWLSERWGAIRDRARDLWQSLRDAVVGRIAAMRDRIYEIVRAVATWLAERWKAIRERATSAWENMADAIGRMWDKVKSKVRTPIKAAVDVAINPIIRGINRVARKVGIGELSTITIPQFHKGGVVGQGGDPRNLAQRPLMSDEQLAVLRKGERVLTQRERRYYENDPAAMLPEVGGPLSWAKSVTSRVARSVRETIAKVVRPAIDAAMKGLSAFSGSDTYFGSLMRGAGRRAGTGVLDWLTGAEKDMPAAPALGSGIGWQKMWSAVRSEFPWARLTSAMRPGAKTATGNSSYHSMGRAIDLAGVTSMNHPQMLQINRWLYENYKAQTKELIYSGRNSQQVRNGKDFMYSGVTRQNHFDHVHWAMDNGGFLQPGMNPPIYNGLGRPEIVSPERLMRRIVREEVTRVGAAGGDSIININGDLVLPNIKSGDDAEEFIDNIKSLAGR
jgi:TP901 family phage tail tape measure protein